MFVNKRISLLFSLSSISHAFAQADVAAQNATASALLYGYPLLAFEKVAPLLVSTIGANQIHHALTLSTATDRQVVKPNVDTLYSTTVFDLSHSDVIITVPEIPRDQYALYSYYDPYGDNFANTGTGNLEASGQYRLTVRPNGTSSYGIQANGSNMSQYRTTIYSPSTYGILLIRWLVNATNLDALHAYQNATSVRSIARSSASPIGPYLSELNGTNPTQTPAQSVLSLLAEFAANNGPEVTLADSTFDANLAAAGILNGQYSPLAGVNLTLANQTAVLAAAQVGISSLTPLNNGWTMVKQNQTGDFGANYGLRSAIASSGYLMLKAPNAIYPSWSNASASSPVGAATLNLGAGESLLYTFSSKPPLQQPGFWSLTAYADNYLIPNAMNVYALGDRSKLTYAHGGRVYGIKASTQDETFQILVQPADVAPPANWTSNWLPGPAGGGDISVLLRWYLAGESLLDGSYVYPVVTKQAAITVARNGTNATTSTPTPASYTGAGDRRVAPSLTVVTGGLIMLAVVCM